MNSKRNSRNSRPDIRLRADQFARLILPCIFVALVIHSLAAASLCERLPVKTYTASDGLLRTDTTCVMRDSRGLLWFCSLEGLTIFDGYEFTHFTTEDGLPARQVNDVIETSRGEILVATNNGVAKLNPHGSAGSKDNPLFLVFQAADPRSKRINFLYQDSTSRIWVGTAFGLFILEAMDGDYRLNSVGLDRDTSDTSAMLFRTALEDRSGAMWFGTNNGLCRLPRVGTVLCFDGTNTTLEPVVTHLALDSNGRMWAGRTLLVKEPVPGEDIVESEFSGANELPTAWTTGFVSKRDGASYLTSVAGIYEISGTYDRPVIRKLREANGFCEKENWDLASDPEGGIWIASSCGVSKVSTYGITIYGEDDGLPPGRINSIFEDSSGRLFVAGHEGRRSVCELRGSSFKKVQPLFPGYVTNFGWGIGQTVLPDSNGDWWFATGAGLFRFEDISDVSELEVVTPRKLDFGADAREIFSLFEDPDGNVWVTTTGGATEIFRWDRRSDVWHDYTRELDFPLKRLGTSFSSDADGNVWIATGGDGGESALIRYSRGEFTILSEKEGGPQGWTRDLYLDTSGRLWIGTQNEGVWRIDDTSSSRWEFKKYSAEDGLPSNDVNCITEDRFGRIYLGTGRGLSRLTPDTGVIENFGLNEGLPEEFVQLAYRDRNDLLWFSTPQGLFRLSPETERTRKPPKVFIRGLELKGSRYPVSVLGESRITDLVLAPEQDQIRVNFGGIGQSLGEPLAYEYRLTGASSEWTRTAERSVTFANLTPGDYDFEVRAVTGNRQASVESAVISFSLQAPFWRRWYSITGFIALLALVLYYLHNRRVLKLLEMERIRMRIASDLHDDVGANLTRISILSEVAKQESNSDSKGADGALNSIAEIARETVSSMNDIVWAVSPRNDRLQDLVSRMRRFASETLEAADIELDFRAEGADSDRRLSVEVRRNILLILKEAVNNAVKHSGCSRVQILFDVEENKVKMEISDNGRGIDYSDASDGNGFPNMNQRATDLNGNIEISSDDSGTTVRLIASLN